MPPVALIATGHGILMKVKKSREHRGENTLFSSLPEPPPRHTQELNVSEKWERHGYKLQAGRIFTISAVFENTKSAHNSTLLRRHNGYALTAASRLNSIVKRKKKMSNMKFDVDKEAIVVTSEMSACSLERSHLHFKCLVRCCYSEDLEQVRGCTQ